MLKIDKEELYAPFFTGSTCIPDNFDKKQHIVKAQDVKQDNNNEEDLGIAQLLFGEEENNDQKHVNVLLASNSAMVCNELLWQLTSIVL